MDDFADLEAAVARMPHSALDEMLAARRAAESAPPPEPTIVPEPTFPYPIGTGRGGTARFSCPLRCPWYHEENPGAEPGGWSIQLPADFTPDDISAAITTQATARAEKLRARVEAALTEHYERAHPSR